MEENEFSLDVSADISAANSAEEISFDTPKELITPVGDIGLPQSEILQFNEVNQLPPSQPFEYNTIDTNTTEQNNLEFSPSVEAEQNTQYQFNQPDIQNESIQLQPQPSVEAEQNTQYQFNQPDIQNESIQLQPQPTVELPESKLFEPTEERIKAQTQIQQTVIADGNKVDPRDILQKTNSISSDLENLTKDVESISQSMRYPDPRTDSRDNFDQRITIETNNLIFFNRLSRVTEYPNWS